MKLIGDNDWKIIDTIRARGQQDKALALQGKDQEMRLKQLEFQIKSKKNDDILQAEKVKFDILKTKANDQLARDQFAETKLNNASDRKLNAFKIVESQKRSLVADEQLKLDNLEYKIRLRELNGANAERANEVVTSFNKAASDILPRLQAQDERTTGLISQEHQVVVGLSTNLMEIDPDNSDSKVTRLRPSSKTLTNFVASSPRLKGGDKEEVARELSGAANAAYAAAAKSYEFSRTSAPLDNPGKSRQTNRAQMDLSAETGVNIAAFHGLASTAADYGSNTPVGAAGLKLQQAIQSGDNVKIEAAEKELGFFIKSISLDGKVSFKKSLTSNGKMTDKIDPVYGAQQVELVESIIVPIYRNALKPGILNALGLRESAIVSDQSYNEMANGLNAMRQRKNDLLDKYIGRSGTK